MQKIEAIIRPEKIDAVVQAIEEAGFRIEWVEHIQGAPGTPEVYGLARRV